MELIWSNDGVSSEENRNFLQGKPRVDGIENQEREKRKIPTPPRIHEESLGAWGHFKKQSIGCLFFWNTIKSHTFIYYIVNFKDILVFYDFK